MARSEQETIARRFYEQGASGQWDDELIAADIDYHGPPMIGELHGRDAFKQVLNVFRTAFPGFTTTVDDVLVDGDRVAVRHTHYATQTGDFAGVSATGRTVLVPGIEICPPARRTDRRVLAPRRLSRLDAAIGSDSCSRR